MIVTVLNCGDRPVIIGQNKSCVPVVLHPKRNCRMEKDKADKLKTKYQDIIILTPCEIEPAPELKLEPFVKPKRVYRRKVK